VKASPNGGSRLRFGQLELDLSREQLLRRGLPVRLGNQPLQILATLLEHPGEVVSREDLRARLWPDGTYVDFDEGLNTAIKTLRYALGDTADNPTFIETIPRRGYRFIAPVYADARPSLEPAPPSGVDRPPVLMERRQAPIILTPPSSTPKSRTAWLIALGLVVAGACWLGYRLAFPPALRVTQTTRLTNSGRLEPWGQLTSDGSRLFFLEREGDHWNNRQISVAGGESMPFGSPPRNTKILAVSIDRAEILFAPFTSRSDNLPSGRCRWSVARPAASATFRSTLPPSHRMEPRSLSPTPAACSLPTGTVPAFANWLPWRAGTSTGRQMVRLCVSVAAVISGK